MRCPSIIDSFLLNSELISVDRISFFSVTFLKGYRRKTEKKYLSVEVLLLNCKTKYN
jgi:hypothetical protein